MAYEPTHEAPPGGLPAFTEPDPTKPPAARLDSGLDVQVLEERDGWAHIACSNGWKAWVDAGRLVERKAEPQRLPPPPARSVVTPAPAASPPPPAASPPPASPAPPPPTPAPAPPRPSPANVTQAQAAPPPPIAAPGAPPGAPGVPGAVAGWTPPSTPGAATVSTGLGQGRILALVGAGIFLVSGWLNWLGVEDFNASAYDAPAKFLIDNRSVPGGLNLGLFLWLVTILGVAAIILSARNRDLRLLPLVFGIAAIILALLFIFQTNSLVSDVNDEFDQSLSLFDFLDPGSIVALVGGALALAGGIVTLNEQR